MRRIITLFILLSATSFGQVVVSLSPSNITLNRTGTQQFTATVTGSGTTTVTWSISPSVGTISGTGLYTAPADYSKDLGIQVTATSVADPTKSATSVVAYHRMQYIGTFFHDTSGAAALVETDGYTAAGGITLNELSGISYDATVCSTWRDPSITRIAGTYYVLSTNGNPGNSFIYLCSSTDLKTWTYVKQIPLDLVAAGFTSGSSGSKVWAPEWFIQSDGTIRVYFASFAGPTDIFSDANSVWKIYETRPSSTDIPNATWTTPVQILGLPGKPIDPFMYEKSGTFYLFFKTWDTVSGIKYMTNTLPTGTFAGLVALPDGDNSLWEAPGVLPLDSGDYVLYADRYNNTYNVGRIDYYISDSAFSIYSPARVATTTPSGPLKHGTLYQPINNNAATTINGNAKMGGNGKFN